MERALGPEGRIIEAAARAPVRATCPDCGGTVLLRHRRLMNGGGITYFWRHSDNRNRKCPSRRRPL